MLATDTTTSSSASDADSTRTVYGAVRPRRVRRRGRGGRRGRGTPRYPLIPRFQVAAIPDPRTALELVEMQNRIARDQAHIRPRHRLPVPSSWDADVANGHIVPGSGNRTETTRRNAGPVAPSGWQSHESSRGPFGTFIEESPSVIRQRHLEWLNLVRSERGAQGPQPRPRVPPPPPGYQRSSSSTGACGSSWLRPENVETKRQLRILEERLSTSEAKRKYAVDLHIKSSRAAVDTGRDVERVKARVTEFGRANKSLAQKIRNLRESRPANMQMPPFKKQTKPDSQGQQQPQVVNLVDDDEVM